MYTSFCAKRSTDHLELQYQVKQLRKFLFIVTWHTECKETCITDNKTATGQKPTLVSRLTVVSRAAKKLQSTCPIKRRAATTVSYLRVGPVSQY